MHQLDISSASINQLTTQNISTNTATINSTFTGNLSVTGTSLATDFSIRGDITIGGYLFPAEKLGRLLSLLASQYPELDI